jgi:Cu-Zn family superoxide dismutase
MKTYVAAALLATLAAACQSAGRESGGAEPLVATAALQPTQGSKAFGEATFEESAPGRVHLLVNVQGLKPDAEHGFHIHEVGDCSSGDGMSAKGHFNPAGKPHGNPAAPEHHAGDLPALKADKSGRARLDAELQGVTLAPGANSIVGRGLIIHADPDDYTTQPTGNSGARVACGVIKAS